MSTPPETRLTIEQLSAETGMTVRNIRSYRTLGLLLPPEVRDGVGYYGDEHIRRLRLVRELQADGFNLKGIKQLLDATHDSGVLLRLRRLMHVPWTDETTEIVTREQIDAVLGGTEDPGLLEDVVDAGILVPLPDGAFEVPSPLLLRIAGEDMRYGIPLRVGLQSYRHVGGLLGEIAEYNVSVFLEHVWRPFERDGYPEERWSDIAEAIEQLRALSAEAVLAQYSRTIAEAIERTLGEELRRISGAEGAPAD
ncbi:MAG: MerR family transcriptional regulator [Solirubrobacteraceae bacterium]|nr:MerR family transcriptional regulator [Solirubrobacteraceae bacterium]